MQTQESRNTQVSSAEEIKVWVISYLADLLEVEPEAVDTDVSFDRYGLDSSIAIGLTGDLGDWLGHDIDPTTLYDYPTIDSLADYLSKSSL